MALDPRDVIYLNRERAMRMVERTGIKQTRALLEDAARDLTLRLSKMPDRGTFTAVQAESTLTQVRLSLAELTGGLEGAVMDNVEHAAALGADGVMDYMAAADRQFRGVGAQPLNLDEAAVFDRAIVGARSSVFNRIMRGPKEEQKSDRAKGGILKRYGEATIENFEGIIAKGMLTRKSIPEMRDELTASSPFLQGAPKHWAERIVRTELMGAHGRGSWEAGREADEQLEDVVKFLSATFDNRTASDSYAVHGQCRRLDEAFETWEGPCQHPPARPADREIIVSHRISWIIPKYLHPKTAAEVEKRWRHEGRKKAHPPIPEITTVPFSQFGK